ncbi:hypothetical protein [Heyndrickxia camelliae]|uniref:Uncharacterized protein n=1 Tax=Heyndrickxia camelliae TaxID=1707093 RepID=A0A2N3LK79_9BACI|nr:hypothetical protein [Heyndrickxia camelliae]PKR85031.1 hypothetical protein CWO92_11760 [Heyndrickxia camelliae]
MKSIKVIKIITSFVLLFGFLISISKVSAAEQNLSAEPIAEPNYTPPQKEGPGGGTPSANMTIAKSFSSAMGGGMRAPSNASKVASSLPKTWDKANTSVDLIVEGKVKQRRYYGSDKAAKQDIDYFHPDNGTHVFPHRHN